MKRKVKFIIATDNVDSDGDQLNLSGISIPDKVLITENFDASKAVGYASLNKTNSELSAEMKIDDKYLDSTPAIGFTCIKSHKENGIRVIDEMKLYELSFSSSPNADSNVKTIREQLKK